MTDQDYPGNEGDEIALPRFEERLRLRLAAAHRAHTRTDGPAPMPRSTPGPGRLRRRAARRSLRVGLAGIAAAAAVVVGVTVIAQEPDPASEGNDGVAGPTGTDATPPTEDLATRIISATSEAEATMVVHVRQDNSEYGDDESWSDETTGAYRNLLHYEDGSPSFDSSSLGTTERLVDHCFSEWSEGTNGLPIGPGSATGWVQRGLEDGSTVEDGTVVIDGRELIRLVELLSNLYPSEDGGGETMTVFPDATDAGTTTVPIGVPPPAAPEEEVLGITYVDPETYRPVMRLGYPDNIDGDNPMYVQTYEYLERTPENLANLEVIVPDGFTQVEELKGDGERFDAGCGF